MIFLKKVQILDILFIFLYPPYHEGRYVWEHSKAETQYKIWWKHEFSIGKEPNGNGDCVFKDGFKEPDGQFGWDLFGWADYPCNKNSWKLQGEGWNGEPWNRGIHALCESKSFSVLSSTECATYNKKVRKSLEKPSF